MPNYTYNVPVVYNAEDNETHINKTEILIKDCGLNINNSCTGYNFNMCQNDDSYCQPYFLGDLIYAQIKIDATLFDPSLVEVRIVDSAGTSYDVAAITYTLPQDFLRNNYVTVIIDTGDITMPDIDCWNIFIFLYDQVNLDNYFASEKYCKIECEDGTMLVSGLYRNYDCEGNFYGRPINDVVNGFVPKFRVWGVVESAGFDFEETNNGTKKIKSTQRENFLFRTEKLPYYVAKQLALCFNSEQLTIDGINYKGALKLTKNFDEGSEWIIEETIFIECDEINFTCN